MKNKPTPRGTKGPPTVSVSEFKARCLGLIEEIRTTGRELVITKHGKPVAIVSPASRREGRSYGRWKGLVELSGDIVHTDWSEEFDASRNG
jgi:prevent-host-death family protein